MSALHAQCSHTHPHHAQIDSRKTDLGLDSPANTNDPHPVAVDSHHEGDAAAPEHPTVLAQPPGPPSAKAHAQLPSLAALALNGDAPVEHKLPGQSHSADDDAGADNDRDGALSCTCSGSEPPHKDSAAQRKQRDAHAYSYPPPPSADDGSGTLPYPPTTPHLTRAPIEIATRDPVLGRGVYATSYIPAGKVIEISPVLVLPETEYKGRQPGEKDDGTLKGVEASQLRGYVFTWGRDGSMAVALGIGVLSLPCLLAPLIEKAAHTYLRALRFAL